MKIICFFSGDISRSGGTERVTVELANQLCKYDKKYSIKVLSLNKESENNFFDLNKLINDEYLFFKEKINYKRDYLKVIYKLRRYIKDNNIDILIDVDTILDMFSIPATRFMEIKVVSWEHFNFYENLGVKFRDYGRRLSVRYADCLVTITKEDLEYFQKNLLIKKKIKNIYNPISLIDNENIKYSSDSKVIISAGRLTYQKGFDMLIDIAKKVFKVYPDWKWYILGEGEDRILIEDKIRKYSLENNVILLGNVKNIETYYQQASMFVLTSRFEGLGMVILEAMSYKLPIISFACKAGPSEMIKHNINGFLVQEGDIDDMYIKICKLIESIELRIAFSQSSNIDLYKFDKNRICREWDELISSL